MIPRSHILEWSKIVPWQEPRQIEQDLIITNALMKIYTHPSLRLSLAFRGGTALNKLFFNPPTRYSEDIDFVQTVAEPIGSTIDSLRDVLDQWLGEPKRSFSLGVVTLVYRFASDEGFPLRLKIEINSREHFSVLGYQEFPFACNSAWCTGTAMIRTFKIEELLGTKMRALYQRRKGRDLYDLYIALTSRPQLNREEILHCLQAYLAFNGHNISKTLFLDNMALKLKNKEFCEDILPLLPKQQNQFNAEIAYQCVRENLLEQM